MTMTLGYRVSYGRSNSTTRRSQWCALATEEEFVVSRSTDQTLRVWSLVSEEQTLVISAQGITSLAVSSKDQYDILSHFQFKVS